jgi:hypothetical protein
MDLLGEDVDDPAELVEPALLVERGGHRRPDAVQVLPDQAAQHFWPTEGAQIGERHGHDLK